MRKKKSIQRIRKIMAATTRFLLFFMVLGLCACQNNPGSKEHIGTTGKDGNDGKITIVTTIFPEYDWVKEILGDRAENADITMLFDHGVDLHSYQPTTEDILTIVNSDVFIYVGGESDDWVEDILKESMHPDQKVVNLMETLGDFVKEEEVPQGTQQEEPGLQEDEKAQSSPEPDEEAEYDEHVWLSLRNAKILVTAIQTAISETDPAHKEEYEENAKAYNEKLAQLDEEYKKAVQDGNQKAILFGDRFPFRYLADDYDLDYYAAFAGCSAEVEATFETIVTLSGKVDELGLGTILTMENSDQKIAHTIKENTKTKDQKIAVLDSMQGTTSEDVKAGVTYYNVMKENLDVLKNALT